MNRSVSTFVNSVTPYDFSPIEGLGSDARRRAHAPAFTRKQLRDLRQRSGMKRAGKVLAWWRAQLYLSITLSEAGK